MWVRVANDRDEWNSIVDRSPFSVLHHRYELFYYHQNPLPLIVEDKNHKILFPMRLEKLFRSFKLAISPVHSYASVLPDSENSVHMIPNALDVAKNFLKNIGVYYIALSAPTFHSKLYINSIDYWFKKENASIQTIYAHMIFIGSKTYSEISKTKFTKGARYNIRKAERDGVKIIEIKTEQDISKWIDDIYQCNLSALKRQGREGAFPDSCKEVYLSELLKDKKRLGDYYRIYGAVYNNRLIAYIILHEYNKAMLTTKIMSHTNFLAKYPNDALVAHIIKKACEKNFEIFEYGLERTKIAGKIPSLYPGLEKYFLKFGCEEVPVLIYRLGLTRSGKLLQNLFSGKEYLMTRYAYLPSPIRSLFLRIYAPKRRNSIFNFLNT